jgi:hypothetical protein
MPVHIVERLEVIQVKEHQRAIATPTLADSHRLTEAIIEHPTIG